jgi:hypothetical protein
MRSPICSARISSCGIKKWDGLHHFANASRIIFPGHSSARSPARQLSPCAAQLPTREVDKLGPHLITRRLAVCEAVDLSCRRRPSATPALRSYSPLRIPLISDNKGEHNPKRRRTKLPSKKSEGRHEELQPKPRDEIHNHALRCARLCFKQYGMPS